MKYLIVFVLINFCVNLMSQEYLAINYDSINSIDIYENNHKYSEIIGKIKIYEIFLYEFDTLSLVKISGFRGQSGYIEKHFITEIMSISESDQDKIISSTFQDYWKLRVEHDAIMVGYSEENLDAKKKELEDLVLGRLYPLLPLIKNKICENSDIEITVELLRFASSHYNLYSKPVMWTLLDCYLCQPDLLISLMDGFGLFPRKTFIEQINYSFEDTEHDNSSHDNLKKLKKRFRKWAKIKESQYKSEFNNRNNQQVGFPTSAPN